MNSFKKQFAPLVDHFLMFALRRIPASPRTEHIALRWGFSYQPRPAIVKLRCGKTCSVDRNDYLQLIVRYLGVFEPHCIRIMQTLLKHKGVFIDIGANIGLHTLFASSMLGDEGYVIAVEAAPENFSRLAHNIEISNSTNVRMVNCAVGRCSGMTSMFLPENGNSGMYQVSSGHGDGTIPIKQRTIDEIVEENRLGHVALVKMDIEGSELNALEGALNLLNTYKPPLLIELNRSALSFFETTPEAVKKFLFEVGYDGWLLERSGLVPLSPDSEHNCDECVFIHRSDKRSRTLLVVA